MMSITRRRMLTISALVLLAAVGGVLWLVGPVVWDALTLREADRWVDPETGRTRVLLTRFGEHGSSVLLLRTYAPESEGGELLETERLVPRLTLEFPPRDGRTRRLVFEPGDFRTLKVRLYGDVHYELEESAAEAFSRFTASGIGEVLTFTFHGRVLLLTTVEGTVPGGRGALRGKPGNETFRMFQWFAEE